MIRKILEKKVKFSGHIPFMYISVWMDFNFNTIAVLFPFNYFWLFIRSLVKRNIKRIKIENKKPNRKIKISDLVKTESVWYRNFDRIIREDYHKQYDCDELGKDEFEFEILKEDDKYIYFKQ